MEKNNADYSVSSSSSLVDVAQEELFDLIELGDKDKIENFLESSSNEIWDYRSKENDNSTILHVSVFKKQFEITELFVEDCKKKNKSGLTKFINEKNDQGVTAIHYASFRGNVKIIKLLIENGADINISTNRELNVIHYACQGNRPNSLMYFYFQLKNANNANEISIDKSNTFSLLKKQDSGGSTPLHWAAYSSAEDVLLYLINLDIFSNEKERQDFIDTKDYQGYTALHLSVTSKSVRIVMKLLQHGANPELGDRKGRTPLDLAMSKKYREIADIIRNNQSCQCCNIKAPVKQIKKSIKNIVLIFLFQILTIFLLFISIFSIALNNDSNNEIMNKIFFITYMVLLLLFFIFYFILLIIDPGVKKSNSIQNVFNLLNQDKDLTKYCYKCYVEKTRTSKHCIICNKCYENFDHHCYWINKCVAQNNYCLFLVFLFETFLYLSFLLVISIFGTIHVLKSNDKHFEFNFFCLKFDSNILVFDFINEKIAYIIHVAINIFMPIFDLCFLIPEGILLVLHINVCCFNYKEKKRRLTERSISSQTMEASLMSIVSD